VLGWLAAGAGCGLAGCGGDDPPPGLYATRAHVVYHRGDDRFGYPEDVGVRVTVENTASDRLQGRLRTTLERLGSGTTPAVVDTWHDERDLSLSRGSSRACFVVFEGAGRPGADADAYRARATF
jgi:hypothetical protein